MGTRETTARYLSLPTSKEAAVAIGVNRFFTGVPCAEGHIADSVIRPKGEVNCGECRRIYDRELKARQRAEGTDWASRNPETATRLRRKWQDANRQKLRAANRTCAAKRRAANPEEVKRVAREAKAAQRAKGTDWGSQNREAHRIMINAWAKRFPHKNAAKRAKRRAQELNATPRWLTEAQRNQIQEVYEAAVMLSETTGTRYEVDHIVPLQGKTVSGLHVPWNLRPLTSDENKRRPKFWSFEHQDTSSVGAS